MKIIYLMAGDRLMRPGAVSDQGGLIANVGQTNRDAKERATDSDYARKAAGGKWKPIKQWYVDNQWSDYHVHKELKKVIGVKHLKDEEFLFENDSGDGSIAVPIIENIINHLTKKVHEALPLFVPREYQPEPLQQTVSILEKRKRALLSAFPGWGKSTCAPYIMHKMRDRTYGNLFLFTTPITDSLDGVRGAINTVGYEDCRFSVVTMDQIDNDTAQSILEDLYKGINVVVLISVQGLRRSDTGSRKITKEEITTIQTELRTKLAFLYNIKIRLWIRDEFHKEYGGAVTRKVFEGIEPEYLLDMTATPYNLIELGEYVKEQIIGDTIFSVLKKRKEGILWAQEFPQLSIETWEGAPLRNTELGELFHEEEEWDPRKLVAMKNGQLVHATAIRAINQRMYGWIRLPSGRYIECDSKEKNPLSILGDPELSFIAKEVGVHVLAEGDAENEANVRCRAYVDLLNADSNQKMWYVAAECVKDQALRQGIKIVDIVTKLRNVAKEKGKLGLVIVTHRMLLTGSDINYLGHVVLFDRMNSLNDFIQLNGRPFRIFPDKRHVKIYVACPGMNVSVKVYEVAKAEAHQYGNGDPKEYYDCVPITEYDDNFQSRRVTYEQMVNVFNEYQNRILEGDLITKNYFTKFDGLEELIDGINFDLLVGGVDSPTIVLTKGTNAKVKKKSLRDLENENKDRKLGKNWQETAATMLNESVRIGMSNDCLSIVDVFNTTAALCEFGENNVCLMKTLLTNNELYQAVDGKYQKRIDEIRTLGYE